MKKKILSIILAVLMVTAMAPMFAVGTSAAGITADPDWYDASATELYIYDEEDFMAFMEQIVLQSDIDDGGTLGGKGNLGLLSCPVEGEDGVSFNGVRIYLMNDIDLNPGWIADGSVPNTKIEHSINEDDSVLLDITGDGVDDVVRKDQRAFGGQFYGNGHSIKGIYMKSTDLATGASLFGAAMSVNGAEVIVKDFSIENSYITTANRGLASIFSAITHGRTVTIENVYSDAYLANTCTKTTTPDMDFGGIVGSVGGNLNIKNTVYAGTMTINKNIKNVGGIFGIINGNSLSKYNTANNTNLTYGGNVTAENIAFVGTHNQDAKSPQRVAKFAARMEANTKAVVNNSIFTGTMVTGGKNTYTAIMCGGGASQDSAAPVKIEVNNCIYTGITCKNSGGTAVITETTLFKQVTSPKTYLESKTDNCVLTEAAFDGVSAGDVLTANNVTGFTPMIKGAPMPTAMVNALVNGTQLVGMQVGVLDATAGTYSIRLIGVGNDTNYTKVGMDVTITRDGYEPQVFNDKDIYVVHTKINGRDNGEAVVYNSVNFGGAYAFVANNAPFTVNDGIVTFTVSTYHYEEGVDGKIVDSTKIFTVDCSTLADA